ncbi:MAG: glutamyl-tRNA reductase, partial [Puniceicoccales bacterium]|nr:glutamyl-tRNA reductase [Puniceicoccales bacterium]
MACQRRTTRHRAARCIGAVRNSHSPVVNAPSGNNSLAVLACTHETAPLAVREKLAVPQERAGAFCERLRALSGVSEAVVLNTCNRVEIYTAAAASHEAVLELFAAHQTLPSDVVAAHSRWLSGLPAVEHLFHVAAGVDSQMVGEAEILGQVKDAYAAALARRTTGAVLNRVFQKSFQAAAWVRTYTAVGQGQVSVGNVAVELATRIFGELAASRVLVLGTGEAGRKTAQAFVSRGARAITVASRTFDNARALAAEVGGGAVELAAALGALAQHDIIIGSSAVSVSLASADAVRAAAQLRAGEPLFLIDLGMPRNFAPESAAVSGVYLYNLDDLSAIANENLRARLAEVARARAALDARAARTWAK